MLLRGMQWLQAGLARAAERRRQRSAGEFKARFALWHHLLWSGFLGLVMLLAFEHAPPELWYGLRTQLLLSFEPAQAEVWFVSVLAFCMYSALHMIAIGLGLAWFYFWRRRYFVSMAFAWLPGLNALVILILFGLPVAAG